MRGLVRLATVVGLLGVAAFPALAQWPNTPEEGRRLAMKICSNCHVVAGDQEVQPLSRNSAPNFQDIANRPKIDAAYLQNLLMTIHRTFANGSNMPNPNLTDDQAAAIASYILSLRSTKP